MCTKKFEKKGIITGGRDGVILVWDNMMKQIQKHDLREFRFYSPRVVAICEDKNGKIAIGTRSSEIAEIIVSKHKTVIKGHWDGELWGLTIHTKQP
jgi:microtubule-associated protein-like 6